MLWEFCILLPHLIRLPGTWDMSETKGSRKGSSLARRSGNMGYPAGFRSLTCCLCSPAKTLLLRKTHSPSTMAYCRTQGALHSSFILFHPASERNLSWAVLVRSLVPLPRVQPANRVQPGFPIWLILRSSPARPPHWPLQ